MLNARQGLLHQRDSLIVGEQFGGRPVSERREGRGKPMCRFLLVAEHSDSVRNDRHKSSDNAGRRHDPILPRSWPYFLFPMANNCFRPRMYNTPSEIAGVDITVSPSSFSPSSLYSRPGATTYVWPSSFVMYR